MVTGIITVQKGVWVTTAMTLEHLCSIKWEILLTYNWLQLAVFDRLENPETYCGCFIAYVALKTLEQKTRRVKSCEQCHKYFVLREIKPFMTQFQ